MIDSTGNLYGTTTNSSNSDVIWRLDTGSHTVTTLDLVGPAIGVSANGIARDAAGNLFGESATGGQNGLGGVFELGQGAVGSVSLLSFSGPEGQNPAGGLLVDAAGNLYGTAEGGGPSGTGTVFELSPNGASISGTPTTHSHSHSDPHPDADSDADSDAHSNPNRYLRPHAVNRQEHAARVGGLGCQGARHDDRPGDQRLGCGSRAR